MRRIALAALVAGVAIGAIAGFSSAAKPTAGSWKGKHTHFTVNAAMTRITGWTSKCTGYPLPLKMKVKSTGAFSYKRKKSLMGGPLLTEQVHGKFVSATKATGSASYGRCHEKFTAKTTPPPPTTDTQTTESTESTDTTTTY
jgi:hypothetical protein